MRFIPRRDLWLSMTIWLCVLLLVLSGLSPLFIDGSGIIGGIVIALVCFAIAGFIAWMWVATYYVLEEAELFIRTGPFTKHIAFDSITKMKPITSWISSAATSSRRIEISYGNYESIHVSPLDQENFLMALKMRCPHVRMESSSQD